MHSLRVPIVILGFVTSASLAAGDVCVTCTGPAASYSCSVKKADEIEALAGAKAINKICTQVLKRKGQHAACQVVDGACAGTPTTIGWKDVKGALASGDDTPDQPAAKSKAAATPPPPPAAATGASAGAKAQPPDGSTSAKTAPTTPESAPVTEPAPADPSIGDNLKGAAEKTWKCVSTFFGKC
ncbi:MAG: hypothetical protein Q7T86_09525 [Hyphomicrobiaceae bacterium]|nr:hypothetical protein [Hyphomicrobiaceae bacterium]